MALEKFNFVDIHYHANPDLYKRRYNVIEAGNAYKKLNGAVVLKSHLGCTTIQASIAQQAGYPVFPSIVLNDIAGGIHYKTIIKALASYHPTIPSRVIVDFPTITGRKHISKLAREVVFPNYQTVLCKNTSIINENGKINNEIIDILKIACDYPIVLTTGHASKEELYYLIDACAKHNVPALLLNQPANPLTGLTAENLFELSTSSFVWIEQTALTYLLNYQTVDDFKHVLQKIPRVIYSSDLGQVSQMDVPEWLLQTEQWFNQFNLSIHRKAELCLHNPLNLLRV